MRKFQRAHKQQNSRRCRRLIGYVQTIDQYKQDIEHLQEQLMPTTPPEVKDQRKNEETMHIEEM
jgi:preprotein translocase subunit SecA